MKVSLRQNLAYRTAKNNASFTDELLSLTVAAVRDAFAAADKFECFDSAVENSLRLRNDLA